MRKMNKIISFSIGTVMALSMVLLIRPMEASAEEHEHVLQEVAGKAPTCTEAGSREVKCTTVGCEYTNLEVLPAENHNKSQEVSSASTICGTVTLKKVCLKCAYEEDITKVEHNLQERILVPATCDSFGSKKMECAKEACEYASEEETIAPLGHQYGECTFTGTPGEFKAICTSDTKHVLTEHRTIDAQFYLLNSDKQRPDETGIDTTPNENYRFAGNGLIKGGLQTGEEINELSKIENWIEIKPDLSSLNLKDGEYIEWYVIKDTENNGWHVDGQIMEANEDPVNPNPEDPGSNNQPENPSEDSNAGLPTVTPSVPDNSETTVEDQDTPQGTPDQEKEEVEVGDLDVPQGSTEEDEVDISDAEIPQGDAKDSEEEFHVIDVEVPQGDTKDSEEEFDVLDVEIPQGAADMLNPEETTRLLDLQVPQGSDSETLPQTGTASVVLFYLIGAAIIFSGIVVLRSNSKTKEVK